MKTSSLKPITARHAHGGFTLVELLLVIAIIAVLSTMAVGVIGSAQHDARVAATRSRINIIDRVMQAELEGYEFRRSPVPERVLVVLTNQLITSNGWDANRFLVHFRNLKRMINADLIRTEMPSGRGVINNLGTSFPSAELTAYLNSVGVPNAPTAGLISVTELARFRPAGVRRWASWAYDLDVGRQDGVVQNRDDDQIRSDSAELLYQLLGQIEFSGTSARDALGSTAFADTDGDKQLEVVDAFGDPIAFQLLQEDLIPENPDPAVRLNGDWASSDQVTVLDVVNNDLTSNAMELRNAVRPIRADQVRGFFSSSTLDEINGETEGPADLANF